MQVPGMISLGAGNPNPDAFPFHSACFTLKDGGEVDMDEDLMCTALQYNATSGLPELLAWFRALQQREHRPPRPDHSWQVTCTTGSQDAISKACDMLVSRGDCVLVEDPCYPGALGVLRPLGARIIGVATDSQGIVPEAMAAILDGWDTSYGSKGVAKPRVLYSVPTGHNPSGTTISGPRREAVYALARKHNLIIMEDDPYYFLQLDGNVGPGGFRRPPNSFLSMDTDGRVLRFDSMSKVLSSGLRLGFCTGPAPLVERLVLHMQTAALCTSGLSQAAALSLLRRWGDDGWAAHVVSVQALYRARRDHFISCAQKHLTGLAEWTTPEAGMFVWMKLLSIKDSKALIEGPARDEKVLLVPGQYFSISDEPSNCVRASYSLASPENVDEALRRLGALLRRQS